MKEFPHTARDAMLNERTIIGLEEACAYDAPALYGITDAGHDWKRRKDEEQE